MTPPPILCISGFGLPTAAFRRVGTGATSPSDSNSDRLKSMPLLFLSKAMPTLRATNTQDVRTKFFQPVFGGESWTS